MAGLDNYLALRSRVDELCQNTSTLLRDAISCRPGCDGCCRHLSVSAVEAAALRAALSALPEPDAARIQAAADSAAPEGPCPLLQDGLCLLYAARPIICRTHGLPLLIERDGNKGIDFCPENFQGLSSIPGSAVIDLERLNQLLMAINALFLHSSPGPERLTVAEALRSQPD